MLGVVFALQRFRQYLLGQHVDAYIDHKPLISIVQKPFNDVSPRLQRWLIALMPYDYMLHMPGHLLSCVDALSRAPLPDCTPSTAEARSMTEHVGLVLEASPVDVESIAEAVQDDITLRRVLQRVITSPWHGVGGDEEPYFRVRDQLSAADGLLLFNALIVIPGCLRNAVMALAHEGHPGTEAFCEIL